MATKGTAWVLRRCADLVPYLLVMAVRERWPGPGPQDSPALEVAARIRALGARVAVFDPAAMDRARKVHPELEYAGSVLGAARDADALLVLTEWPGFAAADPGVLAKAVARKVVVDARHALDADAWRVCGWDYRAPDRPGNPPGAPSTHMAGTGLHQGGLHQGGPYQRGPYQRGLHQAGPHETAASFLATAV